jgi:hypothetical protein
MKGRGFNFMLAFPYVPWWRAEHSRPELAVLAQADLRPRSGWFRDLRGGFKLGANSCGADRRLLKLGTVVLGAGPLDARAERAGQSAGL